MHMADALVSPAVGLAMGAVSAAAIGVSAAKVKKYDLAEKRIPVIGVAGAVVFAAQMINFTIPGTGSSGHIGGGMLLAGLLGGAPAFLSISAVLIIQCLFFADGGLLALGCNIFNMGVVPCLIIYPLVFKPLIKNGVNNRRLTTASIVSAMAGLELGAFCVVLQTRLSGIAELPFGVFTALMLPIHLAIGLVEGAVTAAVLCFIYKMRPEILESAQAGSRNGWTPTKKGVIIAAAIAVVIGGALSLLVSSNPDGLEWAIERAEQRTAASAGSPQGLEPEVEPTKPAAGQEASDGESDAISAGAADIQEKTAVLPDYAFASNPDSAAGTSVSGIIGAAATFALAGAAGLIITKAKKTRKAGADA